VTRAILLAACLGLATGLPAVAADDEDFLVATGGDLATLCATGPDNPNHAAAIHMCQGYIVGAHQLHEAAVAPTETGGFYCVPEPLPTRNEVTAGFTDWVSAEPARADLPAIEALMRFAAATYPCE